MNLTTKQKDLTRVVLVAIALYKTMNHQVTFIKDDDTDLTLRTEGNYSNEDALQLIDMLKKIVSLAEKTSIKDFTEMLNQSEDIWI